MPISTYLSPRPDAPAPTQSAVIVPVPAADPVVGAYRDRFDRAASWGVPAHVTVLYPFVAPDELPDAVPDAVRDALPLLAAALAGTRAFTCRFARTAWFDEDVVWLAPEPDEPLRTLTEAVSSAFPDQPPYGGLFDEVVPHLTIGERRLGTVADLRAAADDVAARLPITAVIDHVLVVAGASVERSWRVLHRLDLAP